MSEKCSRFSDTLIHEREQQLQEKSTGFSCRTGVLDMNQTAEDTMVLRCHLLLNNPARIELRSPSTSELLPGSSNSGDGFGHIFTRAISRNKTPFYRGFVTENG